MPRGRKPKPTHLRLLQGNRENRPINKYEPEPRPILPEAPAILTLEARAEWARIVEEVYNLGLLTIVDVPSLAAYCQCYGRWVVAERILAELSEKDQQMRGFVLKSANGTPIANPLLWVATNAARDMVRYAAEFGFTPASRTRIAVAQAADAPSKFGGLLG